MHIQKIAKRLPIALLGLVVFPTYGASLDCSTATNINVPVVECQALLDLYDNIEGSTRQNDTNWDTDTNVCTRYGISCTNISGQDRVTQIDLYNNGNLYVYGPTGARPLPSSLANLSYLEYLNLTHNTAGIGPLAGQHRITGTLPTSRGDLTNLEYINIAGNQISGPLPAEWSGMINLNHLDLKRNTISGDLPDSWSTMTNVAYIDLSNNQIQGDLPDSWGAMTDLTGLVLGDALLAGSYMNDYHNCEATNNNISGSLPASRSSLTNLVHLNLACNDIGGTLPTSRGTLSNLSYLDLTDNQVQGSIPPSWTGLTNIVSLYLGYNQLVDTIDVFSSFSWLENLTDFSIGGNQFTGSLPTSWGNFSNLEYLNLASNEFEGTLPSTWSGMTSLSSLNIASNNLYGDLPESRGTWTNISTADLRRNFLEGYVPYSWTTRWSQTPWTNFSHNCIIVNQFEPPTIAPWPFVNSSAQNGNQNGCVADLRVTQATSVSQVSVGSEVTYTIDYQNIRYHTATDPTIAFDPGATILIANASASYTQNGDTYEFAMPTLPAGDLGQIVVVAEIVAADDDIDSQVSITSETTDPDTSNNQSETTLILLEDSEGSGGNEGGNGGGGRGGNGGGSARSNEGLATRSIALRMDDCSGIDTTASRYDGLCGDSEDIETIKKTGSKSCYYDDGSYKEYVFVDVINTKYNSIVQLLLNHCLVHGYGNEGTEFGLYNNAKLGELYKVFVRLSLLEFSLNHPDKHRSYGYQQAGDKIGLRDGIDVTRNPEDAITTRDMYVVVMNYLKHIGFIKTSPTIANLQKTVTRSSLATVLAMLINMNR